MVLETLPKRCSPIMPLGMQPSGRPDSGNLNYEPSRLADVRDDDALKASQLPLAGTTQQAPIKKTLNFRQAGEYYRSLSAAEQKNPVGNLAGDRTTASGWSRRSTPTTSRWKGSPRG